MNAQPTPISSATSLSTYLTVQEAAELARCHPKTIRRAVHSQRLKASRPVHRWLIRPEDVRAWIEAQPAAEPSRARPSRIRHVRPPAPGSVAAIRIMDPDLSR